MSVEEDKRQLRAAWDELIGEMEVARDTIDNAEFFPPEATSRVLAEGYRYLSGFIHHGVERAFHEDPDFPAFRNALSIFNKSTIENSDAIYFYAPIDGSKHYRVTGKVGASGHWRGEGRAEGTAAGTGLAPQYVIFEVATGPMAGDTGTLAELMPGTRTGFGTVDTADLKLDEDGNIELLLGPTCPDGYQGNYICTRKPPSKQNPEAGDRYADYVSGRQLFYDWESEEAVPLLIECIDTVGQFPQPMTPDKVAANLRRMGAIIRGQMRFWMHFYDVVLNCNETHDTDGQYFMPVNGYNKPNAASADTGGGMSTNIYAGGIYDLAEDEALYIEATFTGEPVYTSMHLANMWGESPDYANHQSSLNLHQMHIGADGKQRWVVAHNDPGVQNWIDSTGLPKGYLSHRWAYSTLPPKDEWPTIFCRKIKFDEIRQQFPEDMPVLDSEARQREIHIRQAHVQRRYRVF